MRQGTKTVMALLLALPMWFLGNGADCRQASAEIGTVYPGAKLAQREMKEYKDGIPRQQGSLYERAHNAITNSTYGPRIERPRIAVIVNGDEDFLVEERVKDVIYAKLREKFPKDMFALMKGTDVNTRLLQYAEDMYYDQRETAVTEQGKEGIGYHYFHILWDAHGKDEREFTEKNSKVDVDGMPIGIRPRGLADMRCEDFVRAGRDCNYDYVLVLTLSGGERQTISQRYIIVSANTVKRNVWLRTRFVDVKNGNYLYRNDVPAQGKAHNGYISGKVFERAVANAMNEILDDIEISDGVFPN